MKKREYYSIRTGSNPQKNIELDMLRRLFKDVYLSFSQRYYFQEAFGYYCVDQDSVVGTLGNDVEAQMFLAFRKGELWPIEEKCLDYSEDDLFDVVEFLHDNVSLPVSGYYHDHAGCGWHYSEFDRFNGQLEFRTELNALLRDYNEGYELSEDGEILVLGDKGLRSIFRAEIPSSDPENITARVDAAVTKFRHRSSLNDRRDAVRDLADVLEYLKPELRKVLSRKDESDLFNLANNFGIRHHNPSQRTDYDETIWYSWMFYYYLATIHAVLRLIEKQDTIT